MKSKEDQYSVSRFYRNENRLKVIINKIIKTTNKKKLRIYSSHPDKCLFVCEDFLSDKIKFHFLLRKI